MIKAQADPVNYLRLQRPMRGIILELKMPLSLKNTTLIFGLLPCLAYLVIKSYHRRRLSFNVSFLLLLKSHVHHVISQFHAFIRT